MALKYKFLILAFVLQLQWQIGSHQHASKPLRGLPCSCNDPLEHIHFFSLPARVSVELHWVAESSLPWKIKRINVRKHSEEFKHKTFIVRSHRSTTRSKDFNDKAYNFSTISQKLRNIPKHLRPGFPYLSDQNRRVLGSFSYKYRSYPASDKDCRLL